MLFGYFDAGESIADNGANQSGEGHEQNKLLEAKFHLGIVSIRSRVGRRTDVAEGFCGYTASEGVFVLKGLEALSKLRVEIKDDVTGEVIPPIAENGPQIGV